MSCTNNSKGTQARKKLARSPYADSPVMAAMKRSLRVLFALPMLILGLLYTGVAQAECGGNLECIAVSIDVAVPPAHGTPLTSAPLAFGSQELGTPSSVRTIFVGAVTGPAGMATLDSINLEGADASQFALVGSTTCVTGVPSLPHDGTTCTIDVVFTPTSGDVKTARVSISTSAITRTVPLSGSGDDGNLPDPTQDINVKSVVRAQIDAAKRFSFTQIDNYQGRIQALRRAQKGSAGGDSQDTATAQFLMQLASSSSTDLASLGATDASAADDHGYNWWGSGTVNWGTRSESDDNQNQRFSSDGISIGVDRRFNNQLAAGLGIGLGSSESDIGDNGAGTSADATSIAAYLSYQQTPDLYIDSVLGFAALDFDSRRYDAVGDALAESSRDGSQLFASISLSYDWSRNDFSLRPYARIDLSNTTLDSVTESGGVFNLDYDEESYDTNRLSFGLLAEAPHVTNFGWVVPHLRLELQVEDEGNRQADVSYVGASAGQTDTISPQAADDNKILLGIGSDFNLRSGVQISAEYRGSFSSGDENDQSFNFTVSSDFENSRAPTFTSLLRSGVPIQVEAGYRHDDNVNRSAEDHDVQSELLFNTVVSSSRSYQLSSNSRFKLRTSLGLEDAQKHQGLDNISLGLRGDWQHRGSGHFSTPTYGLFARLGYDQFDSDLRSGAQYGLGVNMRKPFTDRLALFTALEHSVRDGDNKVFQNDHTGIRAMLNLSTGTSGLVRFGGELREGDIVSSAVGSGNLSQISTALVEDDAYFNEDFIAYRFDGRSTIWTLAYNHRLGSRDALDFALQSVDSEATDADANGSETDYKSQRISIFYLMSF